MFHSRIHGNGFVSSFFTYRGVDSVLNLQLVECEWVRPGCLRAFLILAGSCFFTEDIPIATILLSTNWGRFENNVDFVVI